MQITLESDDKKIEEKLKKYQLGKPESYEARSGVNVQTSYPVTVKRAKKRLVFEAYDISIEETYFWVLNFATVDQAHYRVYKISDYFAASEGSAFFGINQQRLAAQQDKVSQYLGTIANMIKSLFQLVRELRILDERLDMYRACTVTGINKSGNNINADGKAPDKPSEISLKGYWIDLVEGGGKNPSSVYGLAREVGFTTLPDLFFDAPAGLTSDKVTDYIKSKDVDQFNRKVKEVLSRKLLAYGLWKENTYIELKARKIFTRKYLVQHYNVIKLYTQWIKPYLRNIRRMTSKEQFVNHPQLIVAFENTMIEIEFLAVKPHKKDEDYSSCLLVTFMYRTLPSLNYQQEGYNRGPIHVGRVEMDFRGYAWSDAHITNYRLYRDSDDMEILASVNKSVQDAYDALKDDLDKYLAEETGRHLEDEKGEKKEEKAKAEKVYLQPITSFMSAFFEMFTVIASKRCSKCGKLNKLTAEKCSGCEAKFEKAAAKRDLIKAAGELKSAEDSALKVTWLTYFTYKKAHKLLHWS